MEDEYIEQFNCKIFLKTLINDFFGKFIGAEIFALIGTDEQPKDIIKTFTQMNIDEINTALESFNDISIYNKDFSHLRFEFLSLKNLRINIENFRKFIKTSHSGYYYKKAKFFL